VTQETKGTVLYHAAAVDQFVNLHQCRLITTYVIVTLVLPSTRPQYEGYFDRP